jgi:hypothetical protein
MQHIHLPLETDVFENVNNTSEKYILDPKEIYFDEVEDQIETALIYIRNLQLNINIDFSNSNYETKKNWLIKYLTCDVLLDNGIQQLDQSILTIFANEYINLDCILSKDEVELFRNENKELIENCLQFLSSINSIIEILEKNKDNEEINYSFYDGKIIDQKPKFYETLKHLIDYYPDICDALRLYFMNKYDKVLYEYTIKNISRQFTFYKAILQLPTIKFLGLI